MAREILLIAAGIACTGGALVLLMYFLAFLNAYLEYRYERKWGTVLPPRVSPTVAVLNLALPSAGSIASGYGAVWIFGWLAHYHPESLQAFGWWCAGGFVLYEVREIIKWGRAEFGLVLLFDGVLVCVAGPALIALYFVDAWRILRRRLHEKDAESPAPPHESAPQAQ